MSQQCASDSAIVILSAAKVIDSYPWLVESGVIDILLPKKEQIMIGKW